jgi:two-component system osmolarity sensor histidine kinase EnvZ
MLADEAEARALARDVAEMERMIDAFLAFARGDATETPAPADLSALVGQAVEDARRAGQAVDWVPPPPVVLPVRADALGRAVANLLGNAARHASRAAVSVQVSERFVRIVVEDDGPGIPRDRRDEALRPFTRLDAARDPNRGGGVGLGLAIAADVARAHGGSLRLGDSDRLGGLRAELTILR